MSEEKVIRINKVLRELNISLERAVDYLKDKGIVVESNPNTKISDDVYNVLCDQFAGDKGNKEASKEVGEEKRKEKEALRVEREKEIEDKRKQDEERLKSQEVIKARATVTGPVHIGSIDLNPKKVVAVPTPTAIEKTETPVVKIPQDKPVNKEPAQEKAVSEKKEAKPTVEIKEVKSEAAATKKLLLKWKKFLKRNQSLLNTQNYLELH
jgi:translation initiation factor IF-2